MNLKQIPRLIHHGISENIFPGAVVFIAEKGQTAYHEAFGHQMVKPKRKPMQRETVFDLASLTKPIVVGTLIMHLAEVGCLELDAPVKSYLLEFTHQQVSLRHLLTHTSGLPAWRPIYLEVESRDQVVGYLGQIPLEYPTGQKVVYSCLGYILLGKLIERVTGKSLESLAEEQIFGPLEMSRTRYNPPSTWVNQCAATEDSNSFEKRMVNYRRYDWREGVIVGEVHDENAHFLGGGSGNAGLFSTTEDLSRFCQMLIDGGICPSSQYHHPHVLKQESIDQMATVHTVGLEGSRGLGWIILEDGSLYHTGFTGTAVRLHLKKKRYAILLTNRVHPNAAHTGIIDFRNRFYKTIFGGKE